MVATASGGPDVLQPRVIRRPAPGAGQLTIRTETAGVAFGDVLLRQGRLPTKPPVVPGYDVVGRVVATGPGLSGFVAGQRVAALSGTGGYATEVVVEARWVVPVPEELDAAAVTALVLNYLTAWQLLHRAAKARAGQTILVLGASGGVGSALTELAALEGIRVLGTASPRRRAPLEARGVTVVENQEAVDEPVDATFDSVGGPSLRRSRRASKRSGVVVVFGMSFAADADLSRASGLAQAGFAIARGKLAPGPRLVSYAILSRGKKHPADLRDDLTRLIHLLAQGAIQPAVETMPLTAAADAHRRLEAREVVGKLVLVA